MLKMIFQFKDGILWRSFIPSKSIEFRWFILESIQIATQIDGMPSIWIQTILKIACHFIHRRQKESHNLRIPAYSRHTIKSMSTKETITKYHNKVPRTTSDLLNAYWFLKYLLTAKTKHKEYHPFFHSMRLPVSKRIDFYLWFHFGKCKLLPIALDFFDDDDDDENKNSSNNRAYWRNCFLIVRSLDSNFDERKKSIGFNNHQDDVITTTIQVLSYNNWMNRNHFRRLLTCNLLFYSQKKNEFMESDHLMKKHFNFLFFHLFNINSSSNKIKPAPFQFFTLFSSRPNVAIDRRKSKER